jgi:deazaflavin-dependent oxidoreductase (nitroreductase family)
MIESTGGGSVVAQSRLRVPSFVPVFNPVLRRLLRLGVPLGPNALLTVRGRKSGVMRTSPVAVVQQGGRRWVIGTFGDVNWVRNLRVAGEGVISSGKRRETVHAVELTREEAVDFFTRVLVPYVGKSRIARLVLGALGAAEILDDPAGAASLRPVFELR